MASARTSLLLTVLLWSPAIHGLHGPNVCSRNVQTQATRTTLRYYTCPIQKIRRSYVDSETYTVTTPQLFCCASYEERQGRCEPACTHACTNGFCSAPGTCQCHPGYARKSSTECEPSCPASCDHGTCTAPGVCTCDAGYRKTAAKGNSRCVPVCTTPCQHGRCTAPDTCTCDPGYEKRTQSTCKPKCSNGCVNGACSAPEKCVCDEFYVKDTVTGQCVAEVFDVEPE